MVVQDEDGRRWLVLKGDPAWELVGRIKKRPLVLPVQTLTRGIALHPERVRDHLERLQAGYELTGDEAIREAFVRAVALYDCLEVLR